MEIIQFKNDHIQEVIKIWNDSCGTDMVYKPFNDNDFINKFLKNPHFSYEGTFVAIEEKKIVGFANGLYKKNFLSGETYENSPGYITFVLVDKAYRRRGIGKALLNKVEEFLINNGKRQLDIIFFNPINLQWYVPGTDEHDHPNAPGVDFDSAAYKLFQNCNYKDKAKQNSYHLNLDKFSLSEKVIGTLENLKTKGISIEYFDPLKHSGFNELFDDLKNEYWRIEIIGETQTKNPRPILVASDNGKICGFTGPLDVQPSGRGYFAGIGVDSSYGGMGIGTALFFKLCENLRNEGASFMTLFTGENNPARKMYETAGFDIVKTWSDMRKEI